ncbi:uncharacterized protein LOC105219969 isoform X2 [Zeugodacus cucurbitae]|uniref:uncharacterized protein LOC105219969 isoform X2 n=1 Tax=Zeugodacus cucurbitae TaxID=28588 RepID=UPI0023D94C45|nr:uncharacterized protein LOC105219969 isoform X2 [Zeugodacus cucurbitae]
MYSYFEIQMEIIHIMLVALLLLSNKVNGLEDIFMETPITSISMSPEEAPIITAALLECSKNIKDGNRQKLENYSQIRRQLLVNIRVNPSFNVEKVDKFLILDEVFDAKKSSKAKIMSPYLIEISRGEPVIMYPLEFARSLKLDELNNTKLIDNSYHGQNVTNQMEEVPKLKSGPRNSSSYLEREGTQRKKNYGSETLYGNNQSLNNSRQDYFASDVSEIEDNFDPANANGINRLPISSASVENQFVEQEKKESSSDNKQFPESFKAEAIFPKVSRLHDNNYNGPNGQKIKGIVETKRQVDLWKSNTNKSESSNIVYAEPKKYSGGIYDGSDRTVDSIENLVHYQHSMLKSPISLGSRKGHRRVYKPRFSKHRQHPKIFNSGGNEYDISSEEGNRYFKKGYCPNIYDWLNKRTADYAFQNLLNESFNSKFKNERKKIFEKGDKTFQKDSTGVHIFPTIPDKRRNHDNYAELFECRVRTPKKNTRNSNINSKEPNIHEKIMKNDEGLISPNGFHASGIFSKNMNPHLSEDISMTEKNTPDFNNFYEDYCTKIHIKFQNQQLPGCMQKFERTIRDPHHKYNDKQGIIESIEPHDVQTEKILINLLKETEYPLLVKTNPFPVLSDFSKEKAYIKTIIENSKQKKSLTHNALKLRSKFNDNNYDTIEYPILTSGSKSRHIEGDEQPCSSCGGKNKKPPTKTDSNVMTRNKKCNCKVYQNECLCTSKKIPRSIHDTWYSVFNMSAPLPFLTTKVRIFRKRRNIWFKTAPSITLSSLSGIFANANLSILFSSHVDIIQLEKSLLIQKHQLLIPKDDVNVYQGNIFDKTFKNEKNWLNLKNNENIRGPHQVSPENNLLAYHALDDKYFILPQYPRSLDVKEHFKRKSLHTFIKTLADLGYFPRTMNMLDRCPSNSTRLCLNMLSDKVPVIIFQSVFVGRQLHKIKQFLLLRWIRILFTQDTRYSIKLKMPFQENDIIFQNAFKVKIARIITDTTTKDILQISVDVISESLVGQIFSILISNCGIPCSAARSTVMRPLLPYIGDTITFLLPLMQDVSNKRQKFKCDVLVKVSVEKNLTHYPVKIPPKIKSEVMVLNNSTTISSRTIFVETENRCFCIWHCNCHCITKLETHVNFNICKKMDYEDMQKAGLLSSFSLNKYFEDNFYEYGATRKQEILYFLIRNASILLLIMLILGLLKALIGRFCSTSIDRCGFGYAQSGKRYEDSSDSRRFFLNVVLFIVFPFFFLCKCFAPSDLDLLAASTEWQCEIFEPSPILSEDKSHCSGHGQLNTKKIDKDEDILLSQHMDCCSKKTLDSAKCNNVLTRLRAGDNLCDKKHHLNHIRSIIYNGFLDINKNDDTDEEHNTKYILKTLAESRESLKNLLQSSTIDTLNVVTATNEKFQQASIFVQTLCDAQIVYRTFDRPVGNVQNIPYGITYCIQGYFLPSSETMYEFVSYHPLVQYYGFTFDGVSMEALRPPVLLYAKEFNHLYRDKLEVLNAKDLHIQLPYYVPCINVSSPDFISPFLFKISST